MSNKDMSKTLTWHNKMNLEIAINILRSPNLVIKSSTRLCTVDSWLINEITREMAIE